MLEALDSADIRSLPAGKAGKKAVETYYNILLFLIAYPDNQTIYQIASGALQKLQVYIASHENLKRSLFNTGITNTNLCAAFSFEMVKWLKKNHPKDTWLSSFEANDGQIKSILSVVLPKVESEILQDGNATWKSWLRQSMKKGEDLLDRLIAIFDETDIRPEVKDELWLAIGINIEVHFPSHHSLPVSLITPYYHRSGIKRNFIRQLSSTAPVRVSVAETEAGNIIECARMILVRHLREIDPITFTAWQFISYYKLPRGLSVALMGMIPERRHPIDNYIGYVVFKNGLPVAYAASWILFDSARIGLNVFPAYRGGESQYIFQEVLKLHGHVYNLNRFTVDPYQIGKDNSDGIHSGAFWIYYHAGFRPIGEQQKKLAVAEAMKIKSTKGYRTSAFVLTKLAGSRMELLLQKNPVRFDATDLSRAFANILKLHFRNDHKMAVQSSFEKLAKLLEIKNYQEEKLQFILKNWCILLMNKEQALRRNGPLKKLLKKLFELKATGSEEEYISGMQRSKELRNIIEIILKENL